MVEKDEVIEELEKMSRERFQRLCIGLLEKIGFEITSVKSLGGDLEAEAEIEREDKIEDYVIHVTRSGGDPENEVENLKKVLGPGVKGLYITTKEVEIKLGDNIEIAGRNDFFDLLKEYDSLPQISSKTEDRVLTSASELDRDLKWGDEFFDKGKYEKALEYYDKAISLKPENITARLKKSKVLRRKGDIEGAINVIKKTVEISEENPRIWTELGNALHEKGDLDKEIEAYENALQFNEDYIEAWKGLGAALYERGEYDEALLSFERVLEVEPKDESAWNNKGLCQLKQGDLKEALDSINSALAIYPEFEEALINKMLVLEKQKRFSKAIQVADRLTDLYPENPSYYYIKAAYLNKTDYQEDALTNLNKALELEEDFQKAEDLKREIENEFEEEIKEEEIKKEKESKEAPEKGELEEELKQREEVIKDLAEEKSELEREISKIKNKDDEEVKDLKEEKRRLEKELEKLEEEKEKIENRSLRIDRKKTPLIEREVDILWKMGEYDKAVNKGKDIESSRISNIIGVSKYELEELDKCSDFFEQANNVFSKLNLEYISYNKGNYKKAVQKLREIDDKKIKNCVYWEKLGENLRRGGKIKKAVSAYKNADKLTSSRIKNFKMAEARCKIGAGDVQEGIKLIEDIGKDISYHDVLNLLSAFYFMSEEYKKAEEIMQRIINDEHLYYNNLACIQYKLNNFSKALNNLNRAIELDEENSTYFDNLGVIKLENNKEEKALDDFSKAIRIDGEDAVAWYYKALTMKILGRDGWKESLDMALNIQPDYEVARELRGK